MYLRKSELVSRGRQVGTFVTFFKIRNEVALGSDWNTVRIVAVRRTSLTRQSRVSRTWVTLRFLGAHIGEGAKVLEICTSRSNSRWLHLMETCLDLWGGYLFREQSAGNYCCKNILTVIRAPTGILKDPPTNSQKTPPPDPLHPQKTCLSFARGFARVVTLLETYGPYFAQVGSLWALYILYVSVKGTIEIF